jgi:adenylosuccinate lyase
MLAEDPDISRYLDRTALGRLLDPRHYVGLSASMVDRVLAQSRSGR